MKLLIHNDKVVQIETVTFPVHGDLVWVDTADIVDPPDKFAVGDEYKNEVYTAQAVPVTTVHSYRELRRARYIEAYALGDQIDIIHSQLVKMVADGETTLTSDAQTWVDTIATIKSDIPKA